MPASLVSWGDVGIEVHPVDTLQFHHDVFLLEISEALDYFHGEFGWAFVLLYWSNRRLSAIFRCREVPRRPIELIQRL
jgi:hypothetical protein